jgi:hypothetical protein
MADEDIPCSIPLFITRCSKSDNCALEFSDISSDFSTTLIIDDNHESISAEVSIRVDVM